MTPETAIKFAPEKTVLGYAAGDEIRLTAADFQRLSDAYLAEIENKFL
jgi:hypothetical protein